jgi:hypothetical protein
MFSLNTFRMDNFPIYQELGLGYNITKQCIFDEYFTDKNFYISIKGDIIVFIRITYV